MRVFSMSWCVVIHTHIYLFFLHTHILNCLFTRMDMNIHRERAERQRDSGPVEKSDLKRYFQDFEDRRERERERERERISIDR